MTNILIRPNIKKKLFKEIFFGYSFNPFFLIMNIFGHSFELLDSDKYPDLGNTLISKDESCSQLYKRGHLQKQEEDSQKFPNLRQRNIWMQYIDRESSLQKKCIKLEVWNLKLIATASYCSDSYLQVLYGAQPIKKQHPFFVYKFIQFQHNIKYLNF